MIQQFFMGSGIRIHHFAPAGGTSYFADENPATYPGGADVSITPGIPVKENITLVYPDGSYDTAGGEQRWWAYYLNGQQYRPTSGGTYTWNFTGLLTSIQLIYYEYPYGSRSHWGYVDAIDGERNWVYVDDTKIYTTP